MPLTEKSKKAGTSLSVPSDILGSYEELRWMEPHMSSPSPCCDNTHYNFYISSDVTKRSFTSVQMFHTHTYIYIYVIYKHPILHCHVRFRWISRGQALTPTNKKSGHSLALFSFKSSANLRRLRVLFTAACGLLGPGLCPQKGATSQPTALG